ncbi:MAG TPA: hypothetical protein VGR72_02135 [Candidatus Acidoferrales bacterium]|nr:hypothetical protein [Candidatus Acidoferrales bacterium]
MNALQLIRTYLLACSLVVIWQPLQGFAQTNSGAAKTNVQDAAAERDGSHDFDFLIGNWKAHVRVLRNRLDSSNAPKDWVVYEGISNHKKLLDSNANFEEFDAYCAQLHKRNKGQTLRLYNPDTHQWSIYLVDLDKGTLGLPPVIGQFTGNRGEFYNQDTYKGRAIYVRYVWLNISPKSARMEQSFSADGGKTWEVNWICELSR